MADRSLQIGPIAGSLDAEAGVVVFRRTSKPARSPRSGALGSAIWRARLGDERGRRKLAS
jgi:hypothetical protein